MVKDQIDRTTIHPREGLSGAFDDALVIRCEHPANNFRELLAL